MRKRQVNRGKSFYLPVLDPTAVFVVTSGDEAAYRMKQPEGVSIDDMLPEMIEIAPAQPSGDYMPNNAWEPLNDERLMVHRDTLTTDYPHAQFILPDPCPPGMYAKCGHNHAYCLAQNGE